MSVADEAVVVANRLLRALPRKDRDHLAAHLNRVTLTREQNLHQYNEPIPTVYFPLTAVVSVVQTVDDDSVHEIATIGKDGVVGLSTFLTAVPSPWRAFCQIPGSALSLPADVLGDITTASPGVKTVLARYSQALLVQIARNFACNQLHTMPERCCRWILLVRSQAGRDEFPLTQQSLATMLGVRRATVTVTAGALQKDGLIQYRHGSMRVIDPDAMQKVACECYGAITQEYDRLFATV